MRGFCLKVIVKTSVTLIRHFFSSRKIDPSGMATPIYISILKIIVFLCRYITYDKHLVVHKISRNSYPFYCQVKLSHLDQ